MSAAENIPPGFGLHTPSSKLCSASLGAVTTPNAATSNSSVSLLNLPSSASGMSAPLTPRFANSPRRVVRVEYDTPRVLPSPTCQENSAKRSSGRPLRLRENRTPRRIITVAVNGREEEHRGILTFDIVMHLLERGCLHLIHQIFSFLEATDFNSIQLVSSIWRRAFLCDVASCQRHTDYIQGMKLYVRTVGLENIPHPKPVEQPSTHTQRASVRNVLTDLSNMSTQRREKKPSKALTTTSTAPARLGVTPRRPVVLDHGMDPAKLSVRTPDVAAQKAKKISSAKKDSRMRRLRC